MTIVIKIGGNEIDQPAFLDRLAGVLHALGGPGVLVHGGGKEIAAALERHAIAFEMRDGVRVTTPQAMAVVEQVLSGAINKRLVAALNAAGVPAIGLSGVDLQLLRTVPLRPNGNDIGRVGDIIAVRHEVLRVLLSQGWLPVLSPVSVDRDDGRPVNVNADHAALAVAAALAADELVFVSNVAGVLLDGAVVARLDPAQVEELIAAGVIRGGMVPKARSAVEALAHVGAVRITDLDGLGSGGGTVIAKQQTNDPRIHANKRQ